MKGLDIRVIEVENGWIVKEGDMSSAFPQQMWVASDIEALAELVTELAENAELGK